MNLAINATRAAALNKTDLIAIDDDECSNKGEEVDVQDVESDDEPGPQVDVDGDGFADFMAPATLLQKRQQELLQRQPRRGGQGQRRRAALAPATQASPAAGCKRPVQPQPQLEPSRLDPFAAAVDAALPSDPSPKTTKGKGKGKGGVAMERDMAQAQDLAAKVAGFPPELLWSDNVRPRTIESLAKTVSAHCTKLKAFADEAACVAADELMASVMDLQGNLAVVQSIKGDMMTDLSKDDMEALLGWDMSLITKILVKCAGDTVRGLDPASTDTDEATQAADASFRNFFRLAEASGEDRLSVGLLRRKVESKHDPANISGASSMAAASASIISSVQQQMFGLAYDKVFHQKKGATALLQSFLNTCRA